LSSLISEEQPIPKVKLHCYYCSKYACDLDKFIKHLDWHHSVATTAKDNRGIIEDDDD